MFTNNTNQTFTKLPPSTTEEWEMPVMICATSTETNKEESLLVTAKARDFVFVTR
jgi:hypothetical protein